MIFLIAVGVILLPILLGGLFAWGSASFSEVVEKTKEEVENKDKGLNPTVTFGHEVKIDASPEEMLKQARLEAARRAAAMPRGANMRIGRKGQENLRTAGSALEEDPLTAVRIAMYHGWDGARTGAVAAVDAPAAAPAAGSAPSGKIELVPGKDYEYIEITDSMSPDEKRKARIANSKAKSAAYKAAKAAGVPAGAPAASAAPAAAPTAAPAPQAVNIEPPQLIEITDDMPPDELRRARIANSKAKSAFNKALKAAGVDPSEVEIVDGKVVMPGGAPVAAAAPAAAAAEAAPASDPAAAAANIPKPDLVEITDDMDPDEVRRARIANSKAKSAYNKALKAAGIDPKSVK